MINNYKEIITYSKNYINDDFTVKNKNIEEA